jgi:hypothetical protein
MGMIDTAALREPDSLQLGIDARDAADVAKRITRAVAGATAEPHRAHQGHREQPVHGNRGDRMSDPGVFTGPVI